MGETATIEAPLSTAETPATPPVTVPAEFLAEFKLWLWAGLQLVEKWTEVP